MGRPPVVHAEPRAEAPLLEIEEPEVDIEEAESVPDGPPPVPDKPPPVPAEPPPLTAEPSQSPARGEGDDMAGLVSELVAEDRAASARRRARTRRAGAAWHAQMFDEAYLLVTPPRGEPLATREARYFARLMGLEAGARVLDIGCGAGEHAVGLAQLGMTVTGVDRSEDMLHAAQSRAHRAGVEVDWQCRDMRRLELDGPYDGVLCVGSTLGFFDDAENLEVIRQMVTLASNGGGSALIHTLNRDHVVPRVPTRVTRRAAGIVVLEEVGFSAATSRLRIERQVAWREGEVQSWTYSLRLYSPHELASLFRAAGSKSIRISGSPAYGGSFLGAGCSEQVVTARWA